MGAVLILLTAGMLAGDQYLLRWFPYYPFLFLFVVGLGEGASLELIFLLGSKRRPHVWLVYLGIALLGVVSWMAHHVTTPFASAWLWIMGVYGVLMLVTFIAEMEGFKELGQSIERMSITVWLIAYLGLLPCFFSQLRWLFPQDSPEMGTMALALAVFVPKGCDIGAYTSGRLLGRRKMSPTLSPGKTWEGTVGGLITACFVAIGLDRLGPVQLLRGDLVIEVLFGLSVGVAGVFGDLSESLIKRDCRRKDSSHVVPGFGGILDVVDSVIFASPAVYAWLALLKAMPLAA